MESLSYTFEERGNSLTDDIELSMDGENLFEGLEFVEPGLPEMKREAVLSTRCLENPLGDANYVSGESLPSTSTFKLNSSIEFSPRFSGSAIKINDEKLAPIGLKLEKSENARNIQGNSPLSAQGPSVSKKRARISNSQSQIPVCIVHGCNKDLSLSKEYHKRHKVCEIHSKTAVVIVNGIHQRFCQQCSRFHVLAEFDDGKRSCRKRLAGHNERRRKPQLDTQFDATFYGTDSSGQSLLFSKNLPGDFFSQLNNEPTNLSSGHITAPPKFGCSLPKSPLYLNEIGKQYPPKNCPNSPLSVLELSAGSNSSCAPSLLSAQSQSSLSNSTGISTDYPLTFEEYHHSNLALNQNSTKFRGIFSPSSGEAAQRVLDASVSVGFATPQNELLQESSNTLNLKRFPSPEDGNTVDLLQLSLHLQRVERQKHSDQIRLENGILSHPNTT